MLSVTVRATEGLCHLFRQCGPLLESIAEESTDEEPDEEETFVKRVNSECRDSGENNSPQLLWSEELSSSEEDLITFSDEEPSEEVSKPMLVRTTKKARIRRSKSSKSSSQKTNKDEQDRDQSGETPDITDLSQLREAQASDKELSLIRAWLEQPETVPDSNKFKAHSPEVQQLWAQRQSLEMRDGLLYRKYIRPDGSIQQWQLVVPYALRSAFLDAIHAGAMNGHPGIERTRAKLQEIAYWKGWTTDVLAYVQRCHLCSVHRPGHRRKQGRMQQALACDVMQKVHVDLVGPLVGPFPLSRKGYRYLLTAICGFTKYLVCVPIRDKVSVTVADALMRHLYLVYGAPEILVHDQGGEFWSDVMTRLAELLDIQPSKITSHRPNSNGVEERVHGTLHSMFGKLVSQNQRDWCELVPYIMYAYNTTSHSSTSFSPFYLMYMRRARTPLELLLSTPSEAA